MPRKIRQLLQDLNEAGFHEISGGKDLIESWCIVDIVVPLH